LQRSRLQRDPACRHNDACCNAVQQVTPPDHPHPGATYYYNIETGQTSWELPTDLTAQPVAAAASAAEPAPTPHTHKCNQCKGEIEDGDKFCGHCGGTGTGTAQYRRL
jgi:hypothetical protein